MRPVIAWDTETALIRAGVHAPELACATWQRAVFRGSWLREHEPRIEHWTKCGTLFHAWLKSDDVLVGHNVAYDMGVMGAAFPSLVPLIFDAYDADRVTDTMLRQKLLDIASGCYRGFMGEGERWIKHDYSLFALARRHLNVLLDKDTYRLGYGELRDLPLDQWPEGARQYACGDTGATLDVHLAQAKDFEFLADEFRQARKAFWLHLCSCWGLRTNPAAVERLALETNALRDEIQARLVDAGLVRADGTRNLKAAAEYMVHVCQTKGLPVRRTAPSKTSPEGNVSLDADACEAADDPVLEDYADFVTLGTVLNKDEKALAQGCVFPIHTRFDLAETGRTTSSKPNVQNWARSATGVYCQTCAKALAQKCKDHPKDCVPFQGARECFTPRPGFVFAAGDVDQLELHTLAQVCVTILGHSRLAEVLNEHKDPHSLMASEILGISYARAMELKEGINCTKEEAEAFDNVRQTAKVANFGFPGGLGPEKLVWYARKSYGVDLGKGQTGISEAVSRRRWLVRKGLRAAVGVSDAVLDEAIGWLVQGGAGDAAFDAKLAPLLQERDHKTARARLKAHATASGSLLVAESAAIRLKKSWLRTWPEMEAYFAHINSLQNERTGLYDLVQLTTRRVRGGAKYTAACNSFFQGLGADAMARAGWLIARACYVDRSSPLFGSRIVNFPHDEFLIETPDGPGAHDAAVELGRLMVEGGSELLPDVRLKVKPLLTRVWSKKAKAVKDANGRLVPWSP